MMAEEAGQVRDPGGVYRGKHLGAGGVVVADERRNGYQRDKFKYWGTPTGTAATPPSRSPPVRRLAGTGP